MQTFVWHGCDKTGKNIRGTIKAKTQQEAKNTLFKQGIAVFTIRQSHRSTLHNLLDRLKNHDNQLIVFFSHSAILLKSGLDSITTLKLVQTQLSSPYVQSVVSFLHADVKKGMRFSQAMAQYPLFSSFMVHSIRAGEEAGNIASIFTMLGHYLEEKSSFEKKIVQAAFMPVITILFAFLIITSVLIWVIPQFELFMMSSEKPLPTTTRLVFSVSRFLRSEQALPLIIFACACVVSFRYFLRWQKFRYHKDVLLAKRVIMLPEWRFSSILGLKRISIMLCDLG